ncbi:MAG: hypothetical protein SGJ10_05115 [Bacteroidota bacterium]|nr:hypothetical protein [Bacteroidota bacterium]
MNSRKKISLSQKIWLSFWTIFAGLGVLWGWLDDFHIEYITKANDFLSNMPLWLSIVLGFIILLALSIVIFYAYQSNKAPTHVKYMLLVALVSSILLIPQLIREKKDKRFYIVYDDETPQFHPELLPNTETQNLNEIGKLLSIGQIDENIILISAVDRPEYKWKKALPSGIKLSMPIFSVQEVVDSNKTDIVDISLLSFSNELASLLLEKVDNSVEIRVFYDEGYEIAANRLIDKIKTINSQSKIIKIGFDAKNHKSLLSKDIAFVLLGSYSSVKALISTITEKDYKMLFLPNWTKPNLKQIAPITLEKPTETNRYCVTSSTFEKIISKDTQTWLSITKIISEESATESKNLIENIKHRIRSNFATDNPIISVTF